MSALDADVVVVGAGAAGLAAAHVLRSAGREVCVLEAGSRAGGAIWTERVAGYTVERGPNTIRIGPALAARLPALGLDPLLEPAAPESRVRFLVREGRLVAVPMGPLAFVRTPLLSARGKLRLLAEPFVRRGDPTGESVADFVARRLGREALDALVAPFLTGVYAGDERTLGAEAVFPALVAAERRGGSIVRGLVQARGGPRGRPGTWSARGGLGALVEALTAPLGKVLALGSEVRAVRASADGVEVDVVGARSPAQGGGGHERALRARAAVLAAPAPRAAALVAAFAPDAARALEGICYAPVASVSLGLPETATRERVRGFGFLVPRGESGSLLGCLFPSRLFAGRAPAGHVLLTALLGGVRAPQVLALDDDALLEATQRELDRVLGLREAPRPLAITRWPRAVAQPGPDHPRRVGAVRRELESGRALAVAGAHLDGVAMADALVSGAQAAERILAREGEA